MESKVLLRSSPLAMVPIPRVHVPCLAGSPWVEEDGKKRFLYPAEVQKMVQECKACREIAEVGAAAGGKSCGTCHWRKA